MRLIRLKSLWLLEIKTGILNWFFHDYTLHYHKKHIAMNNRSNDFQPIIQQSMTEMVEDRIRQYLKEKKLKPGDAIPREVEIAEQLGVSRNVIREALSRFKMLGLIESRKKRGMILTEPNIFNGLERVLDPNLLGEDILIDIFEMRLVLEMGLVDLLFMHRSDEHVAELEEIVSDNQNTGKHSFRLEQEVKFHGKLYEITQNKTLQRFQRLLLPIFQYVIKLESHHNHPQKVGKVNHRQLVDLYKHGDAISFRQGMHEHLLPHFEWIAQYKATKQ